MKTLRCHKKRRSSRGIGPEGTTPINPPLSPKRFIFLRRNQFTPFLLSIQSWNLSLLFLSLFPTKFDRPRDSRYFQRNNGSGKEGGGETKPINSVGECSLRSKRDSTREIHIRASSVWQASVKQLVASEEGRSEEAVFPRRWMKKEARAESGMDKWTTFVQMVEPLHNLSRDQQLSPSLFFDIPGINLFTYFASIFSLMSSQLRRIIYSIMIN